jgi:DNA uptake protein ComE-like DNA-binding protein
MVCAQSIPTPQRPQAISQTQTTGEPLDINTATPQQLNALPGFGPAYTKRVIAGRPYTAKNQLVTRGVLPQSAYDRVSSLIIAHRHAR